MMMDEKLLRRIWLLAAILLLAGLFFVRDEWWLPLQPARLIHASDRYIAPVAPTFSDPAKAAAELRNTAMWGTNSVDGDVLEKVDPWAFSGTYFQGREWVAIMTWPSGKKPAQHLRAGDDSPAGYKILRIEQDRMELLISGKGRKQQTLWIPLHKRPPVTW